MAIFLDLEKAFELVDHTVVVYALAEIGVSGGLLRYAASYLEGRSARVRYQGSSSGYHDLKNGVPQGAVLSPFMFNAVIALMYRMVKKRLVDARIKGVHMCAYADDIAIVCTHRLNAQDIAAKFLAIVDQVCKELGLKVSQSETEAMYMFCADDIRQLTIGDTAIEWVKEYRYLGILLDRYLSFVPLATEVADRMRKRLFVMQRISGLTWGAAGTVLEIFYKQAVRSLYDYASPFLAIAHANMGTSRSKLPASKRLKRAIGKIEKVQYQAARLILRVSRTTRTEMLLLETNLEPLYIRAQETLAVFLMKMAAGIQSATAASMQRLIREGFSVKLKLSTALRKALTQSCGKLGT